MDDLEHYRVHLKEYLGDKFTLVFDCMAEDSDHAADQALDMYPGGNIISTTKYLPESLSERQRTKDHESTKTN